MQSSGLICSRATKEAIGIELSTFPDEGNGQSRGIALDCFLVFPEPIAPASVLLLCSKTKKGVHENSGSGSRDAIDVSKCDR
jgi:hypothetical protein